jgi:hypothetical protein
MYMKSFESKKYDGRPEGGGRDILYPDMIQIIMVSNVPVPSRHPRRYGVDGRV